jgi:mRNA interferase RelE/StbE
VAGLAVSARARRDLDRLPPRIAAAIVEFATRTLLENPERMSKPLAGELEGLRSARRGDYRVIFELPGEDGSSSSSGSAIEPTSTDVSRQAGSCSAVVPDD